MTNASLGGTPTPPVGGAGKTDTRERLIAAFMGLLAEKPYERIGYVELAARAGVTLAESRQAFGSPIAILVAFFKEIDRAVLAGTDPDMADEPPRERLFDVLMRCLEALAPHKAAIRSLLRSARLDPALALALNTITVRSHRWMLAAADIDASGTRGMIRAQGLAVLFSRVLDTWIDDEDPGLGRTLAALDDGLARGQWWSGMLDTLCRFVPSGCRSRRRASSRDAPLGRGPVAGPDDVVVTPV